MVAMGGGKDLPTRDAKKEKELVLCTLVFPSEAVKHSIEQLEKEFDNIEVKYYITKFDNGKISNPVVPEGMY